MFGSGTVKMEGSNLGIHLVQKMYLRKAPPMEGLMGMEVISFRDIHW